MPITAISRIHSLQRVAETVKKANNNTLTKTQLSISNN